MKRLLPQLSSILLASISLSPLSAQQSAAKESPSALIIFDASGSMWGQIKGKAKIEIAREVVGNLVKDLPEETELGLMTYGHRRKGDCEDIELLIPVGKVDRSAYISAVQDIMPKGMTPITAALELAAEGLGYKEQKATVILVSDGLETCDADPCAAAKKLEELGVDFTAHVIAFDLKPEESEKLRCIADSTGGKFFPASDAGSLKDALDLAVDAAAPTVETKAPAAAREVELTAPDTATAGSDIEISWKTDTEKGDYVTIAKAKAKDNANEGFAYTFEKTAAKLTTLLTPGDAEIRYISGSTGEIIARRAITLTEFQITLKAPAEAIAGSEVLIEWTGPGYERDFITIVPKDKKDGEYERWNYTSRGNPLPVVATFTTGDAEIRYMSETGNVVLARHPIKILQGEITLKSPAEVIAGSAVSIEWTGPNNKGDFLTIVPKDLDDGKYESWAYTESGSPSEVSASYTLGDAEIRYMNENGNRVLARAPLKIIAAEITMKAAPRALAEDSVSIEWTGPDNKGDFITIVPKNVEDGNYEGWAYTSAGSPLKVEAPKNTGEAEIRYMNENGNRVLARIPITILSAEEK
ncbi:VWA domain-containing protein [Luteolibacter algae]|uniref:VWA domain-containing protein n=1 Tax=Luteolibacter algae TaxID=454151 RepID=A0ABW5D819_9BACT